MYLAIAAHFAVKDRLFHPRHTGKAIEVPVGAGTHAAAVASLFWPEHVALIGTIGHDYPNGTLQILRDRGVLIDSRLFMVDDEHPCDVFTAFYDDDNYVVNVSYQTNVAQRSVIVPPELRDSMPLVYLGSWEPRLQLQTAEQFPFSFTGFDTLQFLIERPDEKTVLHQLANKVQTVLLNDREILAFTHELLISSAIGKLFAENPALQLVVVKCGPKGLFAVTRSREFIFIPAVVKRDDIVDTTGAGDTIGGGLFGYLAKELRDDFGSLQTHEGGGILRAALKMAVGAAALAVCDYGPNAMLNSTYDQVACVANRIEAVTFTTGLQTIDQHLNN
ncbi:hypothetical protein HZB07_06615 [Candidatus Saganbacteria bacterium]|nr:hypothetical protein [Candidatus Saganbacteria bacterium]